MKRFMIVLLYLFFLNLAALFFVGCNGPDAPDFPSVTMESEHIALGFATDDTVCSQWLDELDRYVEVVVDKLGIEGKLDKVPVYIYDKKDINEQCGRDFDVAGCCYINSDGAHGVMLANQNLDAVYHELIHYLIGWELGIRPHSFFDEGMAESLGAGGCGLSTVAGLPLDDVLSDLHSISSRSVLRGFFKQLIGTRGIASVLDWGRAMGQDASDKRLKSSFKDAFGETLEHAWDAKWEDALVRVTSDDVCLGDVVDWKNGEWRHTFSGTCNGDTIYFDAVDSFSQQVVMEITEPGDYFVHGDVEITACDACFGYWYPSGDGRVHMEVGHYSVSLHHWRPEDPVPEEIFIRPWQGCNPFDDPCPSTEKCMDVGSGDFTCVSLREDMGGQGDSCMSSVFGNNDTCGKNLLCGQRRCRPTCTGSLTQPECPDGSACYTSDPNRFMSYDKFEVPGVCFTECNPREPDCQEGETCLSSPISNRFVCSIWDEDMLGDYGYAWCRIDGCGEGLYCALDEDVVPDAESDSLGYCTALCDPEDTDPKQCPDAKSGQWCKPHPTIPNIGYCSLEL